MAAQMILAGMQMLGMGMDAYGQKKQAEDQAEAFEAQARADEQATAFNFKNYHKQASSQIAMARAMRGGSGVELTTGTPLMVDEATIAEFIAQESQIKREGKARAKALRKGGQVAQRSGTFAAASSLLSGATKFAQSGAFDSFFSSPTSSSAGTSAAGATGLLN